MQRLSDLAGSEVLVVTNLSSNARMWSALRGDRPSFYGLNMGLCLPFAVGLALAFPKRRVLALDGDGSLIIETSSLITAADVSPPNLLAIVFDNGNYTDMGETPTSRRTDLEKMAQGAGIRRTRTLTSMEAYEAAVREGLSTQEFTFLVAKVTKDTTLPFVGNYLQRSERGMKESFVDAIKTLPDYAGSDPKNTRWK
jgi:thiamine pyrophosphate-dependent acetolactate synthase large subunit-like protein